MSPLSTLESSFEALNVKKFDGDYTFFPNLITTLDMRCKGKIYNVVLFLFSVAFAVDPLYHQTSAQFDEGGARGLLMNNLGVYGRCRVLFDSSEVPGKCISSENQHDKSDTIDLSFASGEFLVTLLCSCNSFLLIIQIRLLSFNNSHIFLLFL